MQSIRQAYRCNHLINPFRFDMEIIRQNSRIAPTANGRRIVNIFRKTLFALRKFLFETVHCLLCSILLRFISCCLHTSIPKDTRSACQSNPPIFPAYQSLALSKRSDNSTCLYSGTLTKSSGSRIPYCVQINSAISADL